MYGSYTTDDCGVGSGEKWDLAEMLFSDIDSEMPSGRFREGRRAMVRVFYSTAVRLFHNL
jgi:hypothetical protein